MPWVFISCRLSIIKEDGFLFILSRKRTASVITTLLLVALENNSRYDVLFHFTLPSDKD